MALTADMPAGTARARPAQMGQARTGLPWPVIVYLICVVVPAWFHLGPLYMSTLRLLLLVAVVPLVIRLFLGHFGRVYAIDVLMVLHVVWMGVALAVNTPHQAVTQVGSVGMEFLGGYVVARAYIRDRETFVAFCRWLALIVTAMLPLALIETQTGRPVLIEAVRALPGIESVVDITNQPRLGLERAQVFLAHPIHFGLFCSISVALTFGALKDVVPTPVRWTGAVLSGLTGFLALSSGALLAIALQVALIVWAAMFERIRWRWWLLVGLGATAYLVIDLLSNRSPLMVFLSYATFSSHTAYWRVLIFEWGMVNVWGSPIFGIGLNDWVRPWYMFSGTVDNFWLLMAMRYGIPGFLLVVIPYVLGLARVMRRPFGDDPRLRHVRRAWVFCMLGLSFTLCTVHVWTTIYSFTFFVFGAGLWMIAAEPTRGEPEEEEEDGARPEDAPRAAHRYSRFAPTLPARRRAEAPPRAPRGTSGRMAGGRTADGRRGPTAPRRGT